MCIEYNSGILDWRIAINWSSKNIGISSSGMFGLIIKRLCLLIIGKANDSRGSAARNNAARRVASVVGVSQSPWHCSVEAIANEFH